MGIFLEHNSKDVEWQIWELNEELPELHKLLSNTEISAYVERFRTTKRRKEFLCSRILLNRIFKEQLSVSYDKSGKPFIENSDWKISITHSAHFVAVARSKKNIGIDIEQISEKLNRTKHKYASETELLNIDTNQNLFHLALYWSAKESVYKWVGNEPLIFDTEMIIEKFVPQDSGQIHLKLQSQKSNYQMQINYLRIDNFVFTYCVL
jgi:phosphopantetheinyl transferase